MADFNQSKPGDELTKTSKQFRKQMLVKNTYPVSDSEGYSVNHANAMGDGDEKGIGSGKFLDVFGEDIGTKTDIHGNGDLWDNPTPVENH